jgi:hypothetical protein
MNKSEWIWTKPGYALIGILAGSIWCLIFIPFINFINADIQSADIFKIFVITFVAVALINEKLIGRAGIGALYALYGLISSFFGSEIGDVSTKGSKQFTKELATCIVLGCVSALIVIISHY